MDTEIYHRVDKLIIVLKKITESQLKIADESYLEKILKNITDEIDDNGHKYLQAPLFMKWLEETIIFWNQTPPDAAVAGFVLRFVGVFCRSLKEYKYIQERDVIDGLLRSIDFDVFGSSPLKVSYICLLTDLLSHECGYEWIKRNKSWKPVIKMCLSNCSIYVDREAANFILKLFKNDTETNEFYEEIIKDILLPFITCGPLAPPLSSEPEVVTCYEEKLARKITPSLELLRIILDISITSETPTASCLVLKTFEIESILKKLMETSESEILLDTIAKTYVSMLLASSDATQRQAFMTGLPVEVFEVFKLLVKRRKVNNIIKFAHACRMLWNNLGLNQTGEEPNSPETETDLDSDTETHLLIIEMIPFMLFIKKKKRPEHNYLGLFIDKLFHLTDERVQRISYSLRDVIKDKDRPQLEYSLKSALSLTKNIENLRHKHAVLLFQGLTYVFKEFIPKTYVDGNDRTPEEIHETHLLASSAATLLSSILNGFCILIEKFRINWTKSLESLCLLRFCSSLLDNPYLSPLLYVQIFLLLKLVIKNFMSPSLALLTNKTDGSSFEILMPLFYKRLHDPNWEIRDSCIEVVIVLADLAEIKYPAFQELLLGSNICQLIVEMVEGESESYVKASALRAITAMVKIDKMWNNYLSQQKIPEKIFHILRHDSEGIVRREAALVMTSIFENRPISNELLKSAYQVMAYCATHDLHWEVKVNCLSFWEKVIQRLLADQGMIDGSFPSVTFSKQHKKIVTLNGDEIKTRLKTVLNELSKINCLHVLLATLHDDCDFPVIRKSAEILTQFVKILKRYDVINTPTNVKTFDVFTNMKTFDVNSAKRKTSDEGYEKRKAMNRSCSFQNEDMHLDNQADDDIGAKADRVIEDIVNEMDINLLVSVCNPEPEDGERRNKEIFLNHIQPQFFLDKLQYFDFEAFLEEKSKWLVDSGDNLETILDEILSIHSECDTNMLDCY